MTTHNPSVAGSSPAAPAEKAVHWPTGGPNQSLVLFGAQQCVRDASAVETEFVRVTPQRLDGGIRVYDDSATGRDPEPGGRSLQQMNCT